MNIMNNRTLFGSTAVALCLSGFAAFADVTPEEVWENWKSTTSQSGTEMTATSEARDGDTLVISGLSMTSMADPEVTTGGMIDEIQLKDMGDGTVEITMSDSYSVEITTPAVEGIAPAVAQTVTMSISAPGAVTIASGSPDAVTYDFTVPSMEASVVSSDEAADPVDMNISAVNVTGSYLVEGTDTKSIAGTFAAESMALAIKGNDSGGGTDVEMTAAIGAIQSTFDATILEPALMEDMAAAMAAGFGLNFDTTYGATSFTLNVTENGSLVAISGGLDEGKIKFGMDNTNFVYETGSKGLNVTVSGTDIPFPEVKLSLGEGGVGITMPTGPTEEPTDFSFLIKMVDLAISEDIWGMVDPGGALSHDPATIIVDGEGKAQLTASLFSDEAMASDLPPGELISFDLTELLARFAGAELSGTGAFTFDNSDLETFDGMPAPTGKIALKVVGANMLMDKLIGMGLMTQDDAMGARMMMSMFANPGEGEDEFVSELEFKDKGFFANGQRLQ
jgi:hypothetical protein